ncbi:MAG: oxaloacetate decarboxylase [Clostridia bacterium]|nr:oxaloacetate decarboxylase [Clostridia bacterium]
MDFDVQGMLQVLPEALIGWAGVFVVILVLVAAVQLLNRFTKEKDGDA